MTEDKDDIAEYTDIEKHVLETQADYSQMEGQSGFQLFQTFRDAFLHQFIDEGKMHENNPSLPELNIAQSVELVDQAYIDNIILSFIIKHKSPEVYDDCIDIIDKYVRPSKKTEGLAHLYKECAGLLLHLLHYNHGISIRLSSYLSSKIYGITESTPEARYRKVLSKTNDESELSDYVTPFTHLIIFGSLAYLDKDVDTIKPRKKHKRSENEFAEAVQAYKALKKSIFDLYINEIQPLRDHDNDTILDQISREEFDLSFIYEDHHPDIQSEFQLAVLSCIALGMRQIPNAMYHPLAFIQQQEKNQTDT